MRLLAYSLLASVCALTLVPGEAEATSCAPTVEQVVPLDAELLPVTARPHASYECGFDVSGWEAYVDGEPAELLYEEVAELGYSIAALGIEPAPPEGSMVEVYGCMHGCWEEEPEFDFVRNYMVTGEDDLAPPDPGLLELGFSDEIINRLDWDTGEEEMVAVRRWNVHFETPVLDEPMIWVLTVGPEGDESQLTRIMEDGDQNLVITRYVANAGEEVCATARAHDLSGNISADTVICMEVGEDQELPPVPGDGGEDGGTGDSGGDESGDDDGPGDGSSDGGDGTSSAGLDGDGGNDGGMVDETGCSCTAGDSNPLGLGALLGVFALGLRRRRCGWR